MVGGPVDGIGFILAFGSLASASIQNTFRRLCT